jgi:predicted nuclease with TOPRIM domain
MKTLKNIACITLAMTLSTAVFGQKNKENRKAHREKIQAMKVGYITEKLDLTTKEAQDFWPTYNEFDAKMDETRKSMRKMRKSGASIDEMTDAEVEKMISNFDNMRQKELDIHNEYHQKFKAILPIKKVAKLYKAEQGFKRELLKKLKVKKGGPNKVNIPPPPPNGKQ